jgi:hypothetical protein
MKVAQREEPDVKKPKGKEKKKKKKKIPQRTLSD